MLLDPETFELVPRIGEVLDAAAGEEEVEVKVELMQSVLELATPPCQTAGDVSASLQRLRAAAAALTSAAGCRFASAGTHPSGRYEEQLFTDRDRYREMLEELQAVARRQLIFGLHIHVSVDDPEHAIQVLEGLVVHLAELLALSASSPFWRGEPSGLHSTRQAVLSDLPRSGIPPVFGSYAEFVEVVSTLQRNGLISDYTRLWWDLRPHPRLGTVELRICDAVTLLEDAVAIAAYCQALVKRIVEELEAGRPPRRFPRTLTLENKWLAARHGLAAQITDLNSPGAPRSPIGWLIERTRLELEPHARELGSERQLEGVEEILRRGNGADQQLRRREGGASLAAIVAELADQSACVPAQGR